MNRLAAARLELADALAEVLPGRVGAYEPARLARGVAPRIWVGDPPFRPETHKTVAHFPVWFVVDGADHAQHALYDDLAARIFDAAVAAGFEVRDVSPRDVPVDVPADHIGAIPTLRGCVVDVAVTIAGRTLCTSDVEPVLIPPEPLEALSV